LEQNLVFLDVKCPNSFSIQKLLIDQTYHHLVCQAPEKISPHLKAPFTYHEGIKFSVYDCIYDFMKQNPIKI